jgi:hypothetical protein
MRIERKFERLIPKLHLSFGGFFIVFLISLAGAMLFRQYFQTFPQLYNDFVVGAITWSATNRSIDLQTVLVFLSIFLVTAGLLNSVLGIVKRALRDIRSTSDME